MQTIKIDGHELPVPEGCPDFRLNHDGTELVFRAYPLLENGWCRVLLLMDIQKHHAVCVAAEWFEHLAAIDAYTPASWWCDECFQEVEPNQRGECARCSADITAMYDKMNEAAAEAWRAVIEWNANHNLGGEFNVE